MARMIPRSDPDGIENEPERLVAQALCTTLPPEAVIFHSYPWLRPDRDLAYPGKAEKLREGEVDFLVIHPRYGLLVIEVKGGHLIFDDDSARWKRAGGTHEVKDPFEQAARNLRTMESLVRQRAFSDRSMLPFGYTRCVIFPNCEYDGYLPPGADRNMLFTAGDLSRLGQRIESLFRSLPFVPSRPLDQNVLDGLIKSISPAFKLLPCLWSEVQEQERVLFRLTEDQAGFLDFIGFRTRAVIQGVAGSGKTTLALAKARAFADDGKSVLYLCYNELLAEWLRNQLPQDCQARITIRNYHKLCSEWVRAAGLEWPRTVDEATFFETDAPQLLEQAIDLLQDRRFDAIIVDEAQDFKISWWDTIEFLNRHPLEGPLYAFFDPDQAIFSPAPLPMPDLGPPYMLPYNCRNTSKIARHCARILQKNIKPHPRCPDGRTPRTMHAPTQGNQLEQAEQQVREWTQPKIGGLRASQIAIVTCGRLERSSFAGISRLAGLPLTNDLNDWRKNKGIFISSLYRFKGLEADAVLLTDVRNPSSQSDSVGLRREHLYVACSRAKHLLTCLYIDFPET